MTETDLKHRLAAILAADAAGYSRLMAADERRTLATLDAARAVFRKRIESSQGRVVDMAGDSVLAVFDTAAGATSAALAIQRELAGGAQDSPADQRLLFRIGVHLGDVIEKADGTVYGDGVNVAARLQALAEAGGITVSESIRSAVKGKVAAEFDDLGEQTVKNMNDPVRAFSLRTVGTVPRPKSSRYRRVPSARAMKVSAIALGLAVLVVWLGMRWLTPVSHSGPPAFSVSIAALKTRPEDAEAARFADALGRQLATELPRGAYRPTIQLVAPGTGSGARAPSRDDAVGFRYRLEGDVTRAGSRFDIHLRLDDVVARSQAWSARESLQASDVSAEFSPELRALIRKVRGAVHVAEGRRIAAMPVGALSAPELLVRARAEYGKDHSMVGVRAARATLDLAIRKNPNYAPAWTLAALLVNAEGDVNPSQDRERIGREQDEFSARAIALDPSDVGAWTLRATALAYLARWDGALAAVRKAERLDPHDAEAILTRAWLMGLMGRPAEAIALSDGVIRSDPSEDGSAARVKCEAYVLWGKFDAAIAPCEKSVTLVADAVSKVYLTAAYAGSGDATRAASAREELLRAAPGYTVAQLRAKRYSDHPDYLALAEKHWYPALRKAGIPDH